MSAEVAADDIHLSNATLLLEALRHGRVGVWRWPLDGDKLYWSDNLEGIHQLPAGYFDGTLSVFSDDIHADDAARVWQTIQAVLASGGQYDVMYRTNPPSGREPVWIKAQGELIIDADGRRVLTGVCMDVSATVRSEMQLRRRLNQQQAVGRLGSFALSEPSLAAVINRTVEIVAETLQVPYAAVLAVSDSGDHLEFRAGLGWGERDLAEGMALAPETAAGLAILSGEPIVFRDVATDPRFPTEGPLQAHGIVSGMAVLVAGNEQRAFGALALHSPVFRDFDSADVDFLQSLANIVAMSVRADAHAEHRALVVREMTHRAGNMLQLVSSIFNQTFRPGTDFVAAQPAFLERLSALARANVLISSRGWTQTRFISVIEEVLRPYAGRYTASGLDLLLSPELSFDLSLVLHELGSNSGKYGAFAVGDAKALISWELETVNGGQRFVLTWADPVTAGPAKSTGTGFGSKLLSLLIERKWGGTVDVQSSAGYRFRASIPLAEAALPAADRSA